MTRAGSPGDPRRTSSARRRAQLLASFVGTSLLTLGLWIGAPTSASAITGAACSGLDASCLTQPVHDDAAEITRAAGGAASDIGAGVNDAVGGTIDAVKRVVGAAGSPDIPAPGVGGGDDNGPDHDDDGGGKSQTHENDHVRGPSDRSRTHMGRAPQAVVVPNVPPSVRSDSSIAHEGAPDSSISAGTDAGLGVGRIAVDIGHRVALPLALLLVLIVAFVAMQGRLDRDDPKLHLASLDEEVSRFR